MWISEAVLKRSQRKKFKQKDSMAHTWTQGKNISMQELMGKVLKKRVKKHIKHILKQQATKSNYQIL